MDVVPFECLLRFPTDLVYFFYYIRWSTDYIQTIAPGYGDAFEEDQEEQTHPAGRVVVEQFEHIDSTLVIEKVL